MSRIRGEERGGILVLSAILIPVFIVLTAFVVDVGQWYTHKRQLQNRADAAAFAAGVEYAKSWKACVSSDPTLRASAASDIANAARQYAADPEGADYAPGTPPATVYNAAIANQSKLDVVINSTTYTDDTDYSDDTTDPANPTPPPGDPCFRHDADSISSAPGHWTDVRVKENDLPSLFGAIGLPLARNVARARIEIRPAASGNRFLPLAIPNNIITNVQVRYYDECRDPDHSSPLNLPEYRDLKPLPIGNQTTYAGQGGGTLWGLPLNPGDPEGDPARSFPLTIPEYDPVDCDTPYLPVSVEVRLSSRPEIDLNQDCQQLLVNVKFADCFTHVSQIRVWDDGNPDAEPLIKNVTVTGGCAARTDAYFSPYGGDETRGNRECSYGASVEADFGSRATTASNFQVEVNGIDLDPPAGGPNGVWTTAGTPILASTRLQGGKEKGDNNIHVTLRWTPPTGGPKSYSEDAHQVYIGTTETAGAIDLVRTSESPFSGNLPGGELANVIEGAVTKDVYPTIAIRSVLKAGIYVTLRTEDPQGSQLVQCDPAVPDGQEFDLFDAGCAPWFDDNPFTDGDWWNTTTRQCPKSTDWFLTDAPAPYTNSQLNPWRCVLQATGSSVGQTGDWMAVATENCANKLNNQCQTVKVPPDANCGNYDGTPTEPFEDSWLGKKGDSGDPRVINLFIIPYQALKSVSGASAEIPLLGFASFYVMNWKGQNASENDPCPDTDFGGMPVAPPGKGSITGVFVETVTYESGPVDEEASCFEGQLTPCRASLVR